MKQAPEVKKKEKKAKKEKEVAKPKTGMLASLSNLFKGSSAK